MEDYGFVLDDNARTKSHVSVSNSCYSFMFGDPMQSTNRLVSIDTQELVS